MIAAVGDTPYNIVYLVHITSVIMGVGMAFLAPMMAVRARRASGQAIQELVTEMASQIMFPMFLVAGLAGGSLAAMSADFYDFADPWLSIGGTLWFVVLGLTLAIYPPSWLRLFNIAEDRKAMLGGLLHLSLAATLVMMTFKFGDAVGVG